MTRMRGGAGPIELQAKSAGPAVVKHSPRNDVGPNPARRMPIDPWLRVLRRLDATRSAHRRYVPLDGDLLVLRRGRVVDRLPLVDIDDIAIAGWMDTRHIISDPTPLPTGPTQSCLGTPAAPSTSRGHDLRARPAARSADTRLNDILRS
jgi:hypothetical protein